MQAGGPPRSNHKDDGAKEQKTEKEREAEKEQKVEKEQEAAKEPAEREHQTKKTASKDEASGGLKESEVRGEEITRRQEQRGDIDFFRKMALDNKLI